MYEQLIAGDWDTLRIRLTVWASLAMAAWAAVAVACLCDMWSGVRAARRLGEKVHSHRLRETVEKIREYAGVLLPFLLVDAMGAALPWYGLPYAQMLISLGGVTLEAVSIFENRRRSRSRSALIPRLAESVVKCVRRKDAEQLVKDIESLALKERELPEAAATRPAGGKDTPGGTEKPAREAAARTSSPGDGKKGSGSSRKRKPRKAGTPTDTGSARRKARKSSRGGAGKRK